jgi:hypothetical protein
MADDYAAEVFVYTGVGEGAVVPDDVIRVRIDPSVLVILERAFSQRYKMETIELHDGIREIGQQAFSNCKALNLVHLSDGVESIKNAAFAWCIFTKFRSPPLVTTIPHGMLNSCRRIFSLEVPETIIRVEYQAFGGCYSLRNVALTSNTVVAHDAFIHCWDLSRIFDSLEEIVNALRNRFDGLPFHSTMYYISYYSTMTAEEILNTIIIDENELDPTGFQQDCLGMTPLHILACSTVQCLELYQLMVDKYPNNLIVEDAWGALPLLYAIWGDAPSEIVQFLVNRHQSLYPDHEFDWEEMVITLGRANAPSAVIQNLLEIQQSLSPGYSMRWNQILDMLSDLTDGDEHLASSVTFCFLIRCSTATRVNAIGVKHFRDAMSDVWMGDENDFDRHLWLTETLTKLEYYESEYRRLNEMTSLLELSLWKARISSVDHGIMATGVGNKKTKMDVTDLRLQCRTSCGADHVIENVLPYMLPPDFVRSHDNSDDDEDD